VGLSQSRFTGITVKLDFRNYYDGMTKGLVRCYGSGHLHFITSSCYRRQPQLHTASRRDLFLRMLEEARCKYRFVVHGYVVMPEHFHLRMSEPEVGDPSVVMKVIKQRFARHLNGSCNPTTAALDFVPEPVWQKRFCDFNVWSDRKRTEKLRYMHHNPVKRGLVEQPEQWEWSSYRAYFHGEDGAVRVNFQEWPVEIQIGSIPAQTFVGDGNSQRPLIRKERE
jgi:putative transposase